MAASKSRFGNPANYNATPATRTDGDASSLEVDATGNLRTAGGVASGSTNAGNPVKSGGVYNSTPPTVTDGQVVDTQSDANGNTLVRETYQPGYEDNTNNVAKVEQRFSYSAVALADTQVKSSAGFLHTLTISCNDAAPTAGSLIVYDNTAESGTIVFNHTFTTTPFVPFSVILDCTMATGIYVGMTTTNDVNFSCSYR